MKRFIAAAALGAAIIGATGVADAVSTKKAQPTSPARSRSTDCQKTQTSGSGPTYMSWCISRDGNIMKFESPATAEHIRVGDYLEGYAVCSDAGSAYDLGSVEAGWGAPSYPGGLTVVRSSGRFRLEQRYSQNTTDKIVTITMIITNTSGTVQTNVKVARLVDFDVNRSPASDKFGKSYATITAFEDNMMALSGISFPYPRASAVETYSSLAGERDCTANAPVAVPTAGGDYAGMITYLLGNLGAGQSRTVVFRYIRM